MYIVERVDKDYIRVENEQGDFIEIPKNLVKESIKEGDVLDITIKINKEETIIRKERMTQKLNKLFKN